MTFEAQKLSTQPCLLYDSCIETSGSAIRNQRVIRIQLMTQSHYPALIQDHPFCRDQIGDDAVSGKECSLKKEEMVATIHHKRLKGTLPVYQQQSLRWLRWGSIKRYNTFFEVMRAGATNSLKVSKELRVYSFRFIALLHQVLLMKQQYAFFQMKHTSYLWLVVPRIAGRKIWE